MPHADPVTRAAYQKRYRDQNRDKIRASQKAYRARFEEKIKKMKREEYIAHRDNHLARSRKHWERRKEKVNEYRRTAEYKEGRS